MGGERRLDLAQLDAIALDLDLEILAAEELDRRRAFIGAIGPEPPEIPRPVAPLARPRIDREPLRRLRRVAPVAPRHPRPRDLDLPDHPVRAVLAPTVHHVQPLAGQRRAVRNARPVRIQRPDLVRVRPDRRLRGAPQGHHGRGRRPLRQCPRQLHRHPVPTQQHQPQRMILRQAVFHLHRHQRRNAVPDRHPVAHQQLRPLTRVAARLRPRQHQRAAHAQRPEDVVHRQVEAQRRQPQHAVPRTHLPAPVDLRHRRHRRPVLDHHALRLPRRARRVDHVRQTRRVGHRRQTGRRRVGVGLRQRAIDDGGIVEHDCFTAFDQQPAPFRRKSRIDRQVGRTRLDDRQYRNHLAPALGEADRDQPDRAVYCLVAPQ